MNYISLANILLFFCAASLYILKFLFCFHTAQCYKLHGVLNQPGNIISNTSSALCSAQFGNISWGQASLPTKSGHLVLRMITEFALSAYFSSVNASRRLDDCDLHQSAEFPSVNLYAAFAIKASKAIEIRKRSK